MSVYDVVTKLKDILVAKQWNDTGKKVFGSVHITQMVTERGLAELRMPTALIRIGSADVDAEEPALIRQQIGVVIIVSVQGDLVGERAMIGANREAGSPQGRGLLEVEQQMFNAIRLLNNENDIRIIYRSRSEAFVEEDKAFGYIASREYNFDVKCADAMSGEALILTLQPNATTGLDSYIDFDNPTLNFSVNPNLIMESSVASIEKKKGLLKFDLSSIPAGALINSATLSLWTISYATIPSDKNHSLYRNTQDFVESTVNWNTRPTIGGLIITEPISTIAGTENQFDITTAVQNWVDGVWSNYGMTLQRASAGEISLAYVGSSDNSTATYRPKLVVNYTI